MPAEPGVPLEHEGGGAAPGLAEAAERIGRRSRLERFRRGCLVSAFTLALFTLAAELALRATDQRERFFAASVNKRIQRWVELTACGIFEEIPDPLRRYAMRPGARCEVEGWLFRVTRHRTRGEDFPSAKAPRERRLLCLGDSFAFGLWCDDEETLVGHLARMANERERQRGSGVFWRPVNLGVPGYHSGQQLRALEQDGLELAPDVVLVYFNTNDIEQEGFFFDDELGVLRRDFLPLPTRLRRLLWESHLYGWIANRHARWVESAPAAHLDPRVPYAHVRADHQAATRRALERIVALSRAAGAEVFFVHQPLMTYLGDTRRRDWPVLPLVEWGERMRRELGVPGLSLLGWMRGYADGVDRMADAAPGGEPPPEFLLDAYFADERVQAAVAYAKERVRAEGRRWRELGFEEQVAAFSGYSGLAGWTDVEPDFHLTGEGYAHIARVVYPRMQEAGLLP